MSSHVPSPPITIFLSYSHKDETFREELVEHLSILKRQGIIKDWHDRKITAGSEWAGEIDTHLNTAQIILLLVSAAFLASDYCYDIELKRAMERHEAREAIVIPVILRPVDWHGAAFGKLKALPKDAKPISEWRTRHTAFKDVARGIKQLVLPDDLAPTPPEEGIGQLTLTGPGGLVRELIRSHDLLGGVLRTIIMISNPELRSEAFQYWSELNRIIDQLLVSSSPAARDVATIDISFFPQNALTSSTSGAKEINAQMGISSSPTAHNVATTAIPFSSENARTSSTPQSAPYTDDWWLEKRQVLYQAFQADPVSGLEEWRTTFTDALLAWQLDLCKQLVSAPFFPLLKDTGQGTRFQQGIQSILDGNYLQALDMLASLVGATADDGLRMLLKPSSRAMLLIFIGRIHLYYSSSEDETGEHLERARGSFEHARELIPEHGLDNAAVGEYYRLKDNKEKARRACEQAIAQAPDQPDGYITLGLLFEDDKSWDEADDQYAKAINIVGQGDITTVSRVLDKLLAPVSGNAYLQLARMLKDDDPEQARDVALRAIRIGMARVGKLQIKHNDDYVERIGFRLLGEIFDVLQDPTNAGLAYYESARRFFFHDEYNVAIELLREASQRYPTYPPIYWYWADTLRALAANHQTAAPQEQVKRAQEVLDVWDKGYAISSPSPDFAGAYLTRALTVEILSGIQPEQAVSLRWETAVNLEQGLLLQPNNAFMWAALARTHSALTNYAVALQAIDRALRLDNDALNMLEERVRILTFLGDERGKEALDYFRKKALDTVAAPEYMMWADQMEILLLFRQQKYPQTAPLVEAAVDREPTNTWLRTIRGYNRRMLGNDQGALEDFRWIWENTSTITELAHPDSSYRGWAAYELGYYAEALAIFQDFLGGISITSFDDRINVVLCYLAQGQLQEAETWFNDALSYLRYRINVRVTLQDLVELEERLAHQPEYATIQEAIARYRQVLITKEEELPEVENLKAAEFELRQVLEVDQPKSDSFVWFAAIAGLARINLEAEHWEAAGTRYRSICETEAANMPSRFPEARVGLLIVAKVYAQLGLQMAARGDLPKTEDYFGRSFELRQVAAMPNAISDVLSELPGLITSPEQAEILNVALRVLTDTSPSSEEARWRRINPVLTAALPEGWFAKESITLVAPDGQANVILSSEPLDSSIDVQQYAEVQGELLSTEFPGYHEFHFEPTQVLGGHEGYMRRFEWMPENNPQPVTQMQLYYVENGRGYTATATTPSSEVLRFELLLRQILGRLNIEP